jgi:hypothetical protein
MFGNVLRDRERGATMQLLTHERTSRIGRLGEDLAEQCLRADGFDQVENLNKKLANFPYADLLAERQDHRYLISVKARNEYRDNGSLNEGYNLVQVRSSTKAALERQGKGKADITRMLFAEVNELARAHDAEAAWATIALRPERGTYSAYFVLLSQLPIRRDIPMLPDHRKNYRCLAKDVHDPRITRDLSNAREGGRSVPRASCPQAMGE